jgi:hypothetical protein
MVPPSAAIRIHTADEPGHPIALDLAATLPHLHHRPPGDPSGQYRRGVAPPGNPVIWHAGQDYRMAQAIQTARAQPTRARWGPERLGPER